MLILVGQQDLRWSFVLLQTMLIHTELPYVYQVLTQIILEQETKGFKMLPTSFLRDVIQHYDNSFQEVFQGYLETSMKSFVDNQERIRGLFAQTPFGHGYKAMEGMASFGPLEDIARQNMAMFEKAVQMFNPFASMFGEGAAAPDDKAKTNKS